MKRSDGSGGGRSHLGTGGGGHSIQSSLLVDKLLLLLLLLLLLEMGLLGLAGAIVGRHLVRG